MLFRFYDVSDGQILFDGQDVRDLEVESVREAIGVVSQDPPEGHLAVERLTTKMPVCVIKRKNWPLAPVLFNNTVEYNIKYCRPEASLAEVEDVARQAALHEVAPEKESNKKPFM